MTNTVPPQEERTHSPHEIYGGDAGLLLGIFRWYAGLILAGLTAGVFILLSNNNVFPAVILAASLPVVACSYYFLQRRRFELVSTFLAVVLILMNTFLATRGLGVHNISNITFPIILIVAGLVSRRRTMALLTLLIIACVAWLVFGELYGLYVPHPLMHSVPGDFFSMAVIVTITAMMVNRLSGTLMSSFQRTQRETEERRLVEEDLRQREAILEAVTFAAEQFLKYPDWRSSIDRVLEKLGGTIHATHAYLFEDHAGPQGEALTSMKYEWTAPGFASDLDSTQFTNSPVQQYGFDEQVNVLKRGDVRLGNTSTFKPIEKELMDELGIKAILEVPIFVNGKEWGAIGFDDVTQEREWTKGEVEALKIAAGILGGAIQREMADAVVQESERIYRQAIEASDAVPYYREYEKGGYTFFGAGIQQITGYPPEEITPPLWTRMVQEVTMIGELAGLGLDEAIRRVRSGEVKAWKCDYRLLTRDGQVRWVADTSIELFNEKNVSYGSIGIMQDITDRKLTEAGLRQREAVLGAITFAAEQFLKSSDWRENINIALERIGQTLNVTHAYLFEHHAGPGGGVVASMRYEWTAPGFASGLNDPHFQNTRILQQGGESTDAILRRGGVFMGNSSNFPELERERLAQFGIKAMVEAPLFINGAWWGTIGFDDMLNEREWGPVEVDALKIAAGILSAAIQRDMAESAVRESERIYRQAITAAGAVPYYLDYRQNRYAFMGEGIERIIGYKPEDVTADLWQGIIRENIPLGEARGLDADEAARRSRAGELKVWKSDMRVVARDGEERWVTDSAVELFDETNISYASVGILQDVTDRKLIEAGLRKRESILEAITFAAEQFLKTPDWRATIDAALERLGREFDVSHAYLFEKHIGPDGAMVGSLRYEWTAPGQLSDLENPAYQNTPAHAAEYQEYYEILDSGEPFVGSTSYLRGLEIERAWMDATGIKALLEMRVVVDGHQWGTLGFDEMVRDRDWSSMEVDVLRIAVNVLGAAIKRQMDEAALQRELEERRYAERKYRDIFNNSIDGIFQSTEDGRFLSVNPAMAHIYGYESPEAMLAEVNDIAAQLYVHPEQRHEVGRHLADGRRLIGYETEDYRKDGSTFWASMSAQAIFDSEGRIMYYEGAVEDITPRKEAEAEREALIQELAKKNAELEQFTYTVSHDLKSPLVTINGFLGYLEQDALSGNLDRLKKDTQRIQEAVQKMQRLLSELLELSRIGRMMNSPETISFHELAQEAADIVHGRLKERDVVVRIQPNLPLVYGDRPRLVEVLQNLLDNSAKYMGDQKEPRIEIGQRGVEEDKPVFFVRDNGIGIAPEHHERVFGLFNKLDARSEGTGVGLALVKRIIEFHGGRIWIESEAGAGATFLFTLPSRAAPDRSPEVPRDSVI